MITFVEIMDNNISKLRITFPNGEIKTFDISDFEYFAPVNELEHKRENIIINLSHICKSFTYDTDERGEIINKDFITSAVLVKSGT